MLLGGKKWKQRFAYTAGEKCSSFTLNQRALWTNSWSIEGFALICLKSNILQDVCFEGPVGGGRGSLQSVKGSCVLRRFKKKNFMVVELRTYI